MFCVAGEVLGKIGKRAKARVGITITNYWLDLK